MSLEGNYYGNCSGCNKVEELFMVPRVGLFCELCVAKLSAPTLLCGVVSGPPLVELAAGFDAEVASRTARLRVQAKNIGQQ